VSHANARLTPRGRQLIIDRHDEGWSQAHIAAAMGISRRCVGKWIRRHAEQGRAGLVERSSRPHRVARRTSFRIETQILVARRSLRCGPEGIAAGLAEHGLAVCPRTVSRVLVRHQVPALALLNPISGEVIRSSKATAVRYERDYPGELVHMDVKKQPRIPQGGGWRLHGRGAGSILRDRSTRVGFDYVHSLIDDHSRFAYSEVLSDEKGATCAAFLERAISYFAAHGITRIERLITDNAWAYRWSLRPVCAAHGIRQKFIRPHCPWQNGKVERLNRTLAIEWAYRRAWASNEQRTAALADWLEHYNNHRRHSALGGKPPISRLTPTS
jgi:transposase InsO family protein